MHVLQVSEPGLDGVFRHVEGLSRHLLGSGHGVSLAYSSIRGSDRLHSLVTDIRKAGGLALDLRIGNEPTPADLSALVRLRSFVAARRPDVIHAHSSKAGGLVRLLPLLGVRTPILYTPNAYYGMGKSGLKSKVFDLAEHLLGTFGTTINVSHDEAAFARDRLGIEPSRQRIIPNGVDVDLFHPPDLQTKTALRTKHGFDSDAKVLGTVGRFSAQKNYSTLYRALIPVLKAHPKLAFFHVGAGTLDPITQKLILAAGVQSRIKRVEYLPDTRAAFQLMDGFALSSHYEGLSYAALEALSSDLPLILSDVPGNREFLRLPLSHCWAAGSEDIPSFSRAILAWLDAAAQPRASNHRETAISRFSATMCHAKLASLYEELTMKRSFLPSV